METSGKYALGEDNSKPDQNDPLWLRSIINCTVVQKSFWGYPWPHASDAVPGTDRFINHG